MHEEVTIQCPYCWESFSYFFSPEDLTGIVYTDCEVCCHPMEIRIQKVKEGYQGHAVR